VIRNLLLVWVICVAFWQQQRIHELVYNMQIAEQKLDDAAYICPPMPDIPHEEALHNLEHPREQ